MVAEAIASADFHFVPVLRKHVLIRHLTCSVDIPLPIQVWDIGAEWRDRLASEHRESVSSRCSLIVRERPYKLTDHST
jgi:hypothetical protein